MTDTELITTHTLSAAAAQALRALPDTTPIYSELLQNAVRTKATHVEITWDTDRGVLTIADDGEGIPSFRHLLDACDAGWASWQTVAALPQFVALYRALRVSRSVEIHSHNRQLALRPSFLSLEPAPEYRAPWRQGTQVCITHLPSPPRTGDEWYQLLSDWAAGFPIPVTFNRQSLLRPYAVDGYLKSRWRDTDLGYLYLPGWEQCHVPKDIHLPLLFCRGVRVRTSTPQDSEPAGILHVDPARFPTQLPHDTLSAQAVEGDRREAFVIDGIRAQWQQRLKQTLQESTPAHFSNHHWSDCVRMGIGQLLCGLPIAPSMLCQYCRPLELVENRVSGGAALQPWNASSLPSVNSVMIAEMWDGPITALASVYACETGLPVLEDGVPVFGPDLDRVVCLEDETLGLDYKLVNPRLPFRFRGEHINVGIQLCDSYHVHCRPQTGCEVPREYLDQLKSIEVGKWSFYDPKKNIVVIPNRDQTIGYVVGQVSDYEEAGAFLSLEYATDSEGLKNVVLNTRNPSSTTAVTTHSTSSPPETSHS